MEILIAGYGIVGKSIKKRFFPNADIFDPALGYVKTDKKYDCCIVCVPTPLMDGKLDTKDVEQVFRDIEAKYFLLKSTVPIGFSDKFNNVMFSPEFSGSTPHSQDVDDEFTIVGATTKEERQFISDLFYSYCAMINHKIYFTTNKEAELIKLTENAYLGYIVTFASEMSEIAEKYGIDYNIVSELLRMDKRMPQSHMHIFKGQHYYQSHCLDKDIPHLAQDSKLLTFIVQYNNEKKKGYEGLTNGYI
ncbi:MAG TPA: hypothetical protein VGC17_08050 [Lactovum miscens]|uniref:hypothetical protein n=1 Tax=Lactovum miscens TaxID=190387 RepID=UPI002ED8541A